jgi:hypothetical protein
MKLVLSLLLFLPFSGAFLAPTTSTKPLAFSLKASSFDIEVTMPPKGSNINCNLKIDPILDVPSEIVEVRYSVPFGLNVEPKKGLAVCTQDGPGGEKVGDVLRYTSQWTLGLPQGDGVIATAAMFSGGISWGCTLFNVMAAKSWEQVVEALVSNVEVSQTAKIVQYK